MLVLYPQSQIIQEAVQLNFTILVKYIMYRNFIPVIQ